ncbi:MAG: DNA-binding protein [Oscillospiraceae bacterium]|nr:DNA-binding protein [Oscillospiraceae bacterium]
MGNGKDLKYSLLLDYYSAMLTDKQADAMDLYYNEDLSLSEIAEDLEISRQGVRDLIKRGEQITDELEEKLCLMAKAEKINELCDVLEQMHLSPQVENDKKDGIIKQIRDLI